MPDARPDDWPSAEYDLELPQLLQDIGAGRKSLPPAKGKRHHFVPKFVLRNFAADSAERKRVHQLEVACGDSRLVPVRTAASEDRLYAGRDLNGEYDNRVESFLGLFERFAAPTIAELSRDETPMRDEHVITLSFYFALQLLRTPDALDALGLQEEQGVLDEIAQAAQTAEGWAAFMASGGLGLPAVPDLERQRRAVKEAISRGMLRTGDRRQHGVNRMVDGFFELGGRIIRSEWVLCHPKEGRFVLNDRGYFEVAPEEPGGFGGWGFPVTPGLCVLINEQSEKGASARRLYASERTVKETNVRILAWSRRHAFGPDDGVLRDAHELSKTASLGLLREPYRGAPVGRAG